MIPCGDEAEPFWLGENPGTTGTATITGSGASLDALAIYVGANGTGDLDVLLGATLSVVEDTYIGYNPFSTGDLLVDGAASSLNTDLFVIGDEGHGEFTLRGGASTFANTVKMGRLVNAGAETFGSGVGLITGAGTWLEVANSLYVGDQGRGDLTIAAGALVTNLNAYVGNGTAGSGEVLVQNADSRWEIAESTMLSFLIGEGFDEELLGVTCEANE